MSCCTPVSVEIPLGAKPAGKIRTVALVGPPNSGKSTLFNRLTGLRQKVANYPGVTVEQRIGKLSGIGRSDLILIDLPGIYSFSTYSEDARVAVDVLHGAMPGTPAPDAVLLVLDSMHLSRQLMLAGPVLALGLPTLILLNMTDVMEARSGEVDSLALATELGAPVAKISAFRGTGLDAIGIFLARKNEEIQRPLQLPILGNAASYRQWATGVSTRTKYKAPLSSETTRRLDGILLASDMGTADFSSGGSDAFSGGVHARSAVERRLSGSAGQGGAHVSALLPSGWIQSLLIDGVWKGVGDSGLSAADFAAVSLYWRVGGFWISGARGADRRPGNAGDRS
jgi:ferrous iron transport protein B